MEWSKRLDQIVHEHDPFNAEPDPRQLGVDRVTDTTRFYSRNHGPIPTIDPVGWELPIDGLVGQPIVLRLSDLQSRFEHVTIDATLQCAGNLRSGLFSVAEIPGEAPWGAGATSSAVWTGVRLADVLASVEVLPEARHVVFEAPDVSQIPDEPQSYGSSIPLHKALSGEVLLAWEMNNEPLLPIHGAPVRVVVPGFIGARSVKWVTRIHLEAEPSTNYFQATAYRLLPPGFDPKKAGPGDGLSLASVALNSAFFLPDTVDVPVGTFRLDGYAYAGDDRAVSRVDVSIDSGATWTSTQLEEPTNEWTWQFWHADVYLTAGTHEVVVRAWDSTGALQPSDPEDVWNPKGYVNNSWKRIIITAR